ncbi:MAG: PilZ domain-containing protein [Nitrospira sp.]|nr:PilZ domain-containing protein [Nitrospira sp.]
MPQSEPVAILLVNAIAEEIKLATLTFRRFFPNCRVDAVYTLEEAFQWGHLAAWQLIVIDEALLTQPAAPVFSELRRLAPYATLVLQTDHRDATDALNALQAGADFLLYKKSPGFLAELALCTRSALDTHAIRMTLTRTQERHGRLIDILSDGLYELDVDGRFVSLSPFAAEMLGYTQDELLGTLYSDLVPQDQQDRARHRFNDRRTGTRAARRTELDLIRKSSSGKPGHTRVRVEISARGLYDVDRRYLGTLGLLHDISHQRRQTRTIDQLEHRLRESDRLLAIGQRFSTLSQNLHAPHTALYSQSQLLLKTIRDAHLIEQVDSLATYAAEAAHLGKELVQITTEIITGRDTINDIIETVLAQPPFTPADTEWIERDYGQNPPPFTGNLDSMMNLLRILLTHARRYVAAIGTPHRLRISTKTRNETGVPIDQEISLLSQTTAAEFEIHIQETDIIAAAEEPPLPTTTDDLFGAYALTKRLGGRLDFLAPVDGFLSIKVWIPVGQPPVPNSPAVPVTPPVSSAGGATTETILQAPAHPSPTESLPSVQPMKPLPDRRKRIRTDVDLPTRITIGNAPYEGVVTNLSSGGASLEIEGVLPSFEQQPVYLLLKTVVSILELDATAYDRGETLRRARIERQTSRVALEFTALDEGRQKILTSFIEAARVPAFAMTVEAQFPPLDRTDDFVATFTETGLRGTDSRETVRVRVTLPVRIEPATAATGSLLGTAVNLSRGGVCVQTEQVLKMTAEAVTLRFSSIDDHDQSRVQKQEVILTGRIVHLAPDPTILSKITPSSSQPGQHVGIRFSQLTPFAEREINRVLAQHVGSSIDFADRDGRPLIMSDRWECRNTHGQAIAVTADHARHEISQDTPIIIVIPGFGSTQTDYIPLSFYLAANHLRVLRYDHSNHVGQSEGNILQITLRNMQTDLQCVLDFVHTTWPTAPVALLAEDIAARVAVKVMALNTLPDRLFLLNPVFDIETALSRIKRSNVIESYRQGHRRGVVNLWGLNVNFDKFVGDAITGGYVDLASSRSDFAQLATPPVILISPRKNRPIEHVFGPQYQSLSALGTVPTVVSLPADVSGESGANDERRTAAFKTSLKLISTSLIGDLSSAQVREPSLRDVYQQRQLEHERIRIRYHVSQATRSALLGAHLAHLPQLENLPDYLALTNELYRRLLPLEPGMTILEIGCGQRNFARHLLTNQAYRSAHQRGRMSVPLRYIGLDQSHESLRLAELQIRTCAEGLPGTLATAVPIGQLLSTSWMHTDWDGPFPLTDGSMERILCHLSLAFIPSPLHCLQQVLRVLHPDGTAVVTCFQPHTDLSMLFRRHLRAADHDDFGSPAQTVLHYLGRLREAIRHGLLHSYERDDLARLLTHAGTGQIQFFPVLDNQLLLAIVRKTKSVG